jgi:hypothetical protein
VRSATEGVAAAAAADSSGSDEIPGGTAAGSPLPAAPDPAVLDAGTTSTPPPAPVVSPTAMPRSDVPPDDGPLDTDAAGYGERPLQEDQP